MASTDANKMELMELKYRYCYATDALDIDSLVELFTPDAYFEIGIYGAVEGHEGIREYIDWYADQDFDVRAHNVFNPVLSIDGYSAEGTWYYLVIYELPNGDLELGHGRYSDAYVDTPGGWKFSSLIARRRISKTLQTNANG